jgi:magnesium transporter
MKRPNYLLHPTRPLRRRARRPPPGSAPGLPTRSTAAVPAPRITVMAYGPEGLKEMETRDPAAVRGLRGRWPVVWINVDGVENLETVRELGEIFHLHRLALEDVVSVPQRAKVESYGDYLFIVARTATLAECVETEQIGIFLGADFVLTFQEEQGDPYDPVRERIRGSVGHIRGAGTDALAYAILDATIDYYFPILEKLGDRLDELEEQILTRPTRATIAALYSVKRDLTALRRALWPARDAVNSLIRDPSPLIDEETRVYLRDCYDHVVQCLDLLESDRELTSSLTDLYLSSIGHRTNEIMRVLTIFSVVFIPLTLIAGIYGMNFDPAASPWNMPELKWAWGYAFALGLMAATAIGMLGYFWRRGWLGSGPGGWPDR